MFATNFQHFNSLVWLYQTTRPSYHILTAETRIIYYCYNFKSIVWLYQTTTPSSPYINRKNQKTNKLWSLPYQFYWNLPEGNILAKFSVASLFLFIFLLWSPRWNFRAISFNDIRTKASVGPKKAAQLSEKAKRAQFQSRLRKKDFFVLVKNK